MVQAFSRGKEDDSVTVRMDITVDLPAEMATELERLGIYEFETCSYDNRRLTASVTTKFYRFKEGREGA